MNILIKMASVVTSTHLDLIFILYTRLLQFKKIVISKSSFRNFHKFFKSRSKQTFSCSFSFTCSWKNAFSSE